MPDLGKKHDCPSCGTKFYDLGKAEPICPKCGVNVKDHPAAVPALSSQAARRRRKAELADEGALLEEEEAPEVSDEPIEAVAEDEDDEGGLKHGEELEE